MRILLTGATGFIGHHVCNKLIKDGHFVRAVCREDNDRNISPDEWLVVDAIDSDTDWGNKLSDIDVVVHLAARVHQLEDRHAKTLVAYRKTNVDGTRKLAMDAAQAGVKRFIFLSSIKVNGEETLKDNEGNIIAYSNTSCATPVDDYGISKWEAEQELTRIGKEKGLDIVILRPPLVYGAGVRANFRRLLGLVYKQLPLPLGRINNSRSLIYVENLADLVSVCLYHQSAIGKTYLVSDSNISTPELIQAIAKALNKKLFLIPVPVFLLELAGAVSGHSSVVHRLISSLLIDSSELKEELGWEPPYTLDEGLERTAHWYLDNLNRNVD